MVCSFAAKADIIDNMSIIENGPLGQSIQNFSQATGCDPRAVAAVATLFALSGTYEGMGEIIENSLNEENANPLAAAMKDAVGPGATPVQAESQTAYPKGYGESQPAELQGKEVSSKEITTKDGTTKTLYTAANGIPVSVPGTYWKYYNKEENKVIVPIRRYSNDPRVKGISENMSVTKTGVAVYDADGNEVTRRKTKISQARQSYTVRMGIKKYKPGERLDRLSKALENAAEFASKKVRRIAQAKQAAATTAPSHAKT